MIPMNCKSQTLSSVNKTTDIFTIPTDMTEIIICGSSSQGNGYLLKSGNEILVLELGCKFIDYVDALKEDFKTVAGCVVTHRHIDHLNPSTAKEFIRRGIDCYVGEEVVKEADLRDFEPLFSNFNNRVGQFTIQTFKAPHNVPNCGFLITTPTKERIVFLTDTTGVSLRFKDVNCIMVECNHDDDTLLDNLDRHDVSMSHPEYHMGLEECCNFCKANISYSTKEVILIHMSHTNINEDYAVKTVKDFCGFSSVSVAHKGYRYNIDNDDF